MKGIWPPTHAKRQEASVLSSIEDDNLIKLLFESIRYNPEEQTNSFFDHVKLLIDQIYGVEEGIILKA